ARAERVARLHAAEADCRGQDVTVAANRVKQAFAGYGRINRLTYHGDVAAWAADRYVTPTNPWRLKQESLFGADRMSFGLAGGEDGWAFRFPQPAARALAGLDPREAVAVDFLFPGDRVRRAYVEVGDFAAGQAFVRMASR